MAECNIKYGFYNLATQDSSEITASSENAFFPTSNIKNPFSGKVFRSETGTSTANIVFDFKTVEEVDLIMIRPDQENGFGFTGSLTIEANPTDVWTSPAFSTSLTPNSTYTLGVLQLSTAQSYRFWRITGTGTSYLELSNIFIGKAWQPERNISLNWSYDRQSLDTVKENEYGNPFITVNGEVVNIKAEHKLFSKSGMEEWDNYISLVGINQPVWIVVDPLNKFSSNEEFFAGQFRFTKIPKYTNIAFSIYNLSINLREYK
jgi:hypothetical protein